MTTTNATNFRKNIFDYLNQAVVYNEVISVSTKNGTAVILSEEDYSGLMETLYLLSHPRTAKELKEAMAEPHENALEYDPAEEW